MRAETFACIQDMYLCRTFKQECLLNLNTYYKFRLHMNKRTEIVVASAILVLVLHTLALSVLASSSGKERVLDSGSSKNATYYIRNEGKKALTLSMYTSNWNPSDASGYTTLSWDYDGQPIDPNEVVQMMFTLSTSAGVERTTSFSFDFTIAGSR